MKSRLLLVAPDEVCSRLEPQVAESALKDEATRKRATASIEIMNARARNQDLWPGRREEELQTHLRVETRRAAAAARRGKPIA